MRKILLYFLLCLVIFASFSSATLISYKGSLERLEYNVKKISTLIPQTDMPLYDIRRHALIVLGVVSGLAEYITNCIPANYDRAYFPIVDRMVPVFWQKPEKVVKKIETFMNDILNFLEKIKKAINYHCAGPYIRACDDILRNLFPTSNKATQLLILSDQLDYNYQQIKRSSYPFNEISFLIYGRNMIRPLVEVVAKILKLLYEKSTCELL